MLLDAYQGFGESHGPMKAESKGPPFRVREFPCMPQLRIKGFHTNGQGAKYLLTPSSLGF
jgi:hypothetical protein